MFVTVWMGVLDLATGQLDFVNAGHNPPLLGGTKKTDYLRIQGDAVLGAIEGMQYHMHQLQLFPGDVLFLYTDGLTEAMDIEKKLYGTKRPLAVLNRVLHASACNIIAAMKQDVEKHVDGAEPSDDLTMLVVRYEGRPEEAGDANTMGIEGSHNN
jgi:sigma-B regulation protein RsbU (phosphoserine phosphatase)